MNKTITPEIFNQELKPILAELDSRLSRKAEEYATQDRYHNFVQSGIELQGVGLDVQDSTLFSIFALMTKHLISVKDMLKDIQNGNDDFTSEYADEKFGDLICYLLLMQVYVKQNYTKQGADKQERRQRIIEDLIQDIDDMSEELNGLGTLRKDVLEKANPLPIMQKISYKGNPCSHDIAYRGLETAYYEDGEHKLQPDTIANGWAAFVEDFISTYIATGFLRNVKCSYGVNTVVLHPQSFSDTKETMLYIHDLGERLNQFYNAEINLVVK